MPTEKSLPEFPTTTTTTTTNKASPLEENDRNQTLPWTGGLRKYGPSISAPLRAACGKDLKRGHGHTKGEVRA